MPKDIFLTLSEAADILRLKDIRTVIRWGAQGRIRIIGERKHLLVDTASIDEYRRGESQWHRERSNLSDIPDASATPARSASRKAARSHTRLPSRSETASTDTTLLLRGRKLRGS